MIIKDAQKSVDYFGMRLNIPNEDGCLATDIDGIVYWTKFGFSPTVEGRWVSWASDPISICTAHLEGVDWKSTLMNCRE